MRTRALPYYEFSEGLFEIDEFDCASVFVIVGEERALVLDTGTGIGDLRWVIEHKITDKPYDVVLTHNHADHIGGAGFFDEVWIHGADADWSNLPVPPTLAGRKFYAKLIADRENKNYAYDRERDIIKWPKEPVKHILQDMQVFDLGGRKVTVYHCPGHTAGECAVIDDKSRILLAGDACNRNLLIPDDMVEEAGKGLERLLALKGTEYDLVYNSHHDFRGFGSPLGDTVLPDAVACLKAIQNHTAAYKKVPDTLATEGSMKTVAEYGSVQISNPGEANWPKDEKGGNI